MRTDSEPLASARDVAAKSAARAALTLRPLTSKGEFAAASDLLAGIWGTSRDASPLSSDLLRSLSHADACVTGALSGEEVVGVAVAISGPPVSEVMYSLIAGVKPGFAGRGVGIALKYAQRVWSLERGAKRMLWTYDPLIRRNAHFNLVRLGARVQNYIPEFYPPMHDSLNRMDRTDRLCVSWDLASATPSTPEDDDGPIALRAGENGSPQRSGIAPQPRMRVWIPRDIESMRLDDNALAMRWRVSMADVLQEAEAQNLVPVSVSGSGYYVLDTVSAQ
ncbi:GNAT family N-acetyltransferase [Paenarthrobacter sp. RAF54_2]|uniref:GNAT family N-acetyltransferase n=1 Tax=Paenarthrobacter sp. RAF54_2 TaxID=3233061 RepID=UPI003F9809E3